MNRDFINIKEIEQEHLEDVYQFCFTYSIQPNLKVKYTTKKGISSMRKYSTLPFGAQKDFLIRGIHELGHIAYFFEQHKDNRFHIHAFCIDTVRNVLSYMKDRFTDCKMDDRFELHDHCLLCEKVAYKPQWVEYCQKEQHTRDIFSKEIYDFLNNTKVQYIKIEQPPAEPDYNKYLFGGKFLIEF